VKIAALRIALIPPAVFAIADVIAMFVFMWAVEKLPGLEYLENEKQVMK
jgi:hypothetical protein